MRVGLVALAALSGCAVPVEEAFEPIPVRVVRLASAESAEQAKRVELLFERPAAPHRELARLHALGNPGTHIRYVYGELREEAAALGADALIVREAREKVQPPAAPLTIGRPAAVIGGVLYEVEATAIEYR